MLPGASRPISYGFLQNFCSKPSGVSQGPGLVQGLSRPRGGSREANLVKTIEKNQKTKKTKGLADKGSKNHWKKPKKPKKPKFSSRSSLTPSLQPSGLVSSNLCFFLFFGFSQWFCQVTLGHPQVFLIFLVFSMVFECCVSGTWSQIESQQLIISLTRLVKIVLFSFSSSRVTMFASGLFQLAKDYTNVPKG